MNKLKAMTLQEQGLDTVEANEKLGFADDLRCYDCAVEMLKFFKLKKVKLLTNNPKKIGALVDAGIEVQREVHQIASNEFNIKYLKTKAKRSGHMLNFNSDLDATEQNTLEDRAENLKEIDVASMEREVLVNSLNKAEAKIAELEKKLSGLAIERHNR